MKLVNGQYEMSFENGGIRITKNGTLLYLMRARSMCR